MAIVKKAHITQADYDYIEDYLLDECSGDFDKVFPVGKDYDHNLKVTGRVEFEMVYCGSSMDSYEEAIIRLETYECREATYKDGKELPFGDCEIAESNFEPSKIDGSSRPTMQ